MPFGAAMYFDPRRDKIHLLQFGATMLPRLFTGNGRMLDGRPDHRGLVRHREQLRVRSARKKEAPFKSKGVCVEKFGREVSIFRRAGCSLGLEGPTHHQTLRHQEPNASSTLDFRGGVSLCVAQSVPLGKRMAKLRMFLNPPWKS